MKNKIFKLSAKDKVYNFIFLMTIFYLTANYYDGFLGPLRKIFGFKLLIIFLILVLIVIIKEKGIKYLITKNNIIISFLIVLGIIPSLLFDAEYVCYLIGYFLFQCAVVYNISRFLKDYNDISTNKIMACLLIIELVFSMFVSNYYNIGYNSNIYRDACADLLEVIANRCGKPFIYCLMGPGKVFATPLLLLLSAFKIKDNKLWLLVTITSLYTIVKSDFLNTYICLFVVLMVWLFSMLIKKYRTPKAIFIIVLIFLSSILIILFLYNGQLLTPSINSKFQMLTNFKKYKTLSFYLGKTQEWIAKGGRVDDYVSGIDERIISYMKPFVVLWSNKFLYNPYRVVASCDCTMLEYLATYGILSILLLYVLKNIISEELIYLQNVKGNILIVKCLYVYIIMQSILSKVTYTDIPIMMFIIVPFVLSREIKE